MAKLRMVIRRELVFLALGTMDACVITPLLAAFLSWMIPIRPLAVMLIFLGAVLAVHYLVRLTLRLSLHPLFRSGLLGLAMLASGLLIVHRLLHARVRFWSSVWLLSMFRALQQENLSTDVLLFLLVLFVWWRGLALAQRRVGSATAVSRFRWGVVMLAITTVIGGFILPSPPYPFVFVFFFVSLLGIALARAEEVGQQYEGGQSPFGVGWLATLVVAGLLVLFLAAGVATVLTGENVGFVINPLLEAQRTLLTLLTYALLYVMAWAGNLATDLLQDIFGEIDISKLERLLVPPATLEVQAQFDQPLPFTPEQLAFARAVGVSVGVLVLLVLVVLSLRQLRLRRGQRHDEERESVWAGLHLRRGWRDLLRDGRQRMDEMVSTLPRASLSRLFVVQTIRRIYAHMSALAAERGYRRVPHQTPYEYLPTLELAFPDCSEEVVRITGAYVAVHYGEMPERPEELAMVQLAWKRIREHSI
jgi:hypothetical protein